MDEFAGREHNVEGKHVRDGKSVFQAVRTAGVLRHVAANGADRLRRGIGRIKISLRGNSLRYVRINNPGLDDNLPVGKVNIKNAVHARQTDNDAVRSRQCTSAQARPRSATDKRNFVLGTQADHCLHLLGRAGQHHGFRHHPEIRQPVALVRLQLALPDDQPVLTNGGAKPGDLACGQHSRNSLREGRETWPANLSRCLQLAVAQGVTLQLWWVGGRMAPQFSLICALEV